MKWSICIPVYQRFIDDLVATIVQQAKALHVDYEILIVDDASTGSYQTKNKLLQNKYKQVKYSENPKNVGRAKIRNILANKAVGDYCLFLDCDVKIENPDFLQTYAQAIHKDKVQLICGGCTYKIFKQGRKGKELRYKYGKFVEEVRENTNGEIISPFLGCNFVVSKKAFKEISFDESIIQYGFEDVLFAIQFGDHFDEYELINNPVIITDVEENHLYLKKAINAMQNLSILYHQNKILPKNQIRLLMVYEELKTRKLLQPFYNITKSILPVLLMNLNSSNPSLKLFQFFKLYYFIESVLDLDF